MKARQRLDELETETIAEAGEVISREELLDKLKKDIEREKRILAALKSDRSAEEQAVQELNKKIESLEQSE